MNNYVLALPSDDIDKISIIFSKYSAEDYEIYLQEALQALDIKCTIDYSNDPTLEGYTLHYRDKTDTYKLTRLSLCLKKDGHVVDSTHFIREVITTHTVRQAKVVCVKMIEKWFNQKTGLKRRDLNILSRYPDLDTGALTLTSKLDKNAYIIQVNGSGIMKVDYVEQIFHQKARAIRRDYNGYEYFFTYGDNSYSAPSPMGFTYHTGKQVTGIVVFNHSGEVSQMKEIPEVLLESEKDFQ